MSGDHLPHCPAMAIPAQAVSDPSGVFSFSPKFFQKR